MAIVLVQSSLQSNTSGNSTQGTCTLTVTSGNTLVVIVTTFFNASVTATITDSLGNSYTNATGYANGGTSNTVNLSAWYARNIAGGSCTLTVNLSTNCSWNFCVLEYSGADQAAPVDGTATGTGSSTTPSSGSVAVSGAGETVVGAVAVAGYSVGGSIAAGTGLDRKSVV